MKVLIKKSTKPEKKYMAIFCDCDCKGKKNECGKSKRTKTIHFGSANMSDFTKHKDKKRQKNYLDRSGGIKNKAGKLTKNDKNSANYWSRRVNW